MTIFPPNQQASLFVVSAASGTGKTSLVKEMENADSNLGLSVSHTTRPMRADEKDGSDYHFVSEATFKRLESEGEFIEHAEVFGNFYGTSLRALQARLQAGEDMLLEIDWQGALQVREAVQQAVTIFILPPSMKHLHARLKNRGRDQMEVIQKRLAGAAQEIAHYKEFDYLVVNDNFEVAKEELLAIVRAERARTSRRQEALAELLEDILQT